jgi:hypothetical protein
MKETAFAKATAVRPAFAKAIAVRPGFTRGSGKPTATMPGCGSAFAKATAPGSGSRFPFHEWLLSGDNLRLFPKNRQASGPDRVRASTFLELICSGLSLDGFQDERDCLLHSIVDQNLLRIFWCEVSKKVKKSALKDVEKKGRLAPALPFSDWFAWKPATASMASPGPGGSPSFQRL